MARGPPSSRVPDSLKLPGEVAHMQGRRHGAMAVQRRLRLGQHVVECMASHASWQGLSQFQSCSNREMVALLALCKLI